jgi:phosphatidylglycerol:prolipoprotein diacylglycerol transferase
MPTSAAGVVGGTVTVCVLAYRRKLSTLVIADVVAPALAIGLGIGRIGCQLSGDGDYGVPTTLPWGMSYPNGVVPTLERVHPAPIYEAVASFAIFAHLWHRRRRAADAGHLAGQYLILAAAVRFVIEFVRRNPAWLAGLTTAQWMSVGAALLGVLLVRRRAGSDAGTRVASAPAPT